MINSILPILIVIILPAFVLFNYYRAIELRGIMAEEVDSYLGDESNPDELKLLVYRSFIDCLDHWLPIAFLRYFFRRRIKGGNSMDKLERKFGSEKTKEALNLSLKLLFINLKLSPVTYFTCTMLLVVVVICRSTWKASSLFKTYCQFRHQAERAFFLAVH